MKKEEPRRAALCFYRGSTRSIRAPILARPVRLSRICPLCEYALFNLEPRGNLRPPGKGVSGFEIYAIAGIRNKLGNRKIESNMANALGVATANTSIV